MAAVALGSGLLPAAALGDLAREVAPILCFLFMITLAAELADEAGVFRVAADRASRVARGSVLGLFFVVVALASASTVLLSLDTTAVLLTPVVLSVAELCDLPPIPFAMATVWLANTASLLLPVSNLTNLLAYRRLGGDATGFVAHTAAPAAVALAGTVVIMLVRYRRELRGQFTVSAPRIAAPDPVLLRVGAAVCLAVGPLVVVGVAPWLVATAAAATLGAAFAVRRPKVLRVDLVPWRVVVAVASLFVVVETLQQHGLRDLLVAATGSGDGVGDLLRLTGVAAGAANLVNNLPAYLALQPTAMAPDRLVALLVGTNVGPHVLPWGSLATVLWFHRCRARGVAVPWRDFVLIGLAGVPLLLVACVLTI
jgi:Na+/H+ antiporter NhaD/arsenite permease-like protein